jgi:hypothetical protein
MSNLNLAFYTCFYGSKNNPALGIPRVPSFEYKCYFYTNNEDIFNTLKLTKWIGIYDNKPISYDGIESCMDGKHIKTMPHEYPHLKHYDYLCFFDNKITNIDVEFVEKYIYKYFIEKNYALLLRKHWFINDSVWNEYDVSMLQERYRIESKKYRSYIRNQLNEGLKATGQLHCACGFLIRNMKHEKMNEINTTWYKHIQECGIQDQISFFFVKQLFIEYIYGFSEIPFLPRIK